MDTNWAYNLDLLAQNGVLDFDAPSYVMNQNPRYVGSPLTPPSPYIGQLPPAPNLNQPEIDEFRIEDTKTPEKNDENPVKNPLWKKLLFGTIAAGALIFGGVKISKLIKNKTLTTKSVTDFFKNTGTKTTAFFKKYGKKTGKFLKDTGIKIGNFFKTMWNKLVNLVKKKP